MGTTPFGELLINELTILTQQRESQYRECHHILGANLTDHLHKRFFVLQDLVDVVHDKRSIGICLATEQGL